MHSVRKNIYGVNNKNCRSRNKLSKHILRNDKSLIAPQPNDVEVMKYTEILRYTTFDEVIETMIDRKAQQIMKKYIKNMIKFFEECCRKSVARNQDLFNLEKLWDTRNLLVHQNGIADELYATKYGLVRGYSIDGDDTVIYQHLGVVNDVFMRLDNIVEEHVQKKQKDRQIVVTHEDISSMTSEMLISVNIETIEVELNERGAIAKGRYTGYGLEVLAGSIGKSSLRAHMEKTKNFWRCARSYLIAA